MKWLLCVCVWERQAVCWHWASPRKNRSSCWRFVRPSAPPLPPSLHPSIRCNWTQLCVSDICSESMSVCWRDPQRLHHTLWCIMLSLWCGVGGFYLAPDALNFQVNTTNSKRHTTNESGFSESDCDISTIKNWVYLCNYYIIVRNHHIIIFYYITVIIFYKGQFLIILKINLQWKNIKRAIY